MAKSILLLCIMLLSVPSFAAEVDRVLVFKAQRQMILVDQDDNIIKRYRIALGDNPIGHKTTEGDEKTPEGSYTLDWVNENSSYYRSFHISYPNKADRAQAKKRGVSPGGAIFIHGLPNRVEDWPVPEWAYAAHVMYDWTNGCIAVTNKEMDEIIDLVHVGTEIYITGY